jgi:hypothetical protein
MVAQCTTAAVLFGTGDVIAQQAIEKKGSKHDVSAVILSDRSPLALYFFHLLPFIIPPSHLSSAQRTQIVADEPTRFDS